MDLLGGTVTKAIPGGVVAGGARVAGKEAAAIDGAEGGGLWAGNVAVLGATGKVFTWGPDRGAKVRDPVAAGAAKDAEAARGPVTDGPSVIAAPAGAAKVCDPGAKERMPGSVT